MSLQKFKKEIVLIEIFLINVTAKVCKSTEMCNCKKCKLFGMSRQCRTPSQVAHVIRTLSTVTVNKYDHHQQVLGNLVIMPRLSPDKMLFII